MIIIVDVVFFLNFFQYYKTTHRCESAGSHRREQLAIVIISTPYVRDTHAHYNTLLILVKYKENKLCIIISVLGPSWMDSFIARTEQYDGAVQPQCTTTSASVI